MSPHSFMIIDENLEFNTNFSPDGFAEYLSLIFEDDNFTAEQLLPSVWEGINTGVAKYNQKNRESDFVTYVTYYVKLSVNNFKNSQ